MSANGPGAITWKPLLICPNADLSHRLSATWRAMGEPEAIVESPRYVDRAALGDLTGGHGETLCFVDGGTDRRMGLGLLHALRIMGIPVVALHASNDPDLIVRCLR